MVLVKEKNTGTKVNQVKNENLMRMKKLAKMPTLPPNIREAHFSVSTTSLLNILSFYWVL